MKPTVLLLLAMLCFSCSTDEEEVPTTASSTTAYESNIIVDLVYVLPSKITFDETLPTTIDQGDYMDYLNETYFHKYNIHLESGTVSNLKNDELFDLKDDRGNEAAVFLNETKNTYKKDRLTIYIISRTNTIAIAGIGDHQRVLMTDEHLYTSTSPHEIGHALGLFHNTIQGNLMNEFKTHPRTEFSDGQVERLKGNIHLIYETH